MQLGIRSPIRYTKAAYTFPKNGVLDNFNRADGGLGANWLGLGTLGRNSISNNAVAGGFDRWATQFGADQECYWKFVGTPIAYDDGQDWYVDYALMYLRLKDVGDSTTDGYTTQFQAGVGQSYLNIVRFDNGVYTLLGSAVSIPAVGNGDQIGCAASGSSLTGWYKLGTGAWALGLTRIDSTYAAGGYIGGGAIDTNGSGLQVDDFGGGTI